MRVVLLNGRSVDFVVEVCTIILLAFYEVIPLPPFPLPPSLFPLCLSPPSLPPSTLSPSPLPLCPPTLSPLPLSLPSLSTLPLPLPSLLLLPSLPAFFSVTPTARTSSLRCCPTRVSRSAMFLDWLLARVCVCARDGVVISKIKCDQK